MLSSGFLSMNHLRYAIYIFRIRFHLTPKVELCRTQLTTWRHTEDTWRHWGFIWRLWTILPEQSLTIKKCLIIKNGYSGGMVWTLIRFLSRLFMLFQMSAICSNSLSLNRTGIIITGKLISTKRTDLNQPIRSGWKHIEDWKQCSRGEYWDRRRGHAQPCPGSDSGSGPFLEKKWEYKRADK